MHATDKTLHRPKRPKSGKFSIILSLITFLISIEKVKILIFQHSHGFHKIMATMLGYIFFHSTVIFSNHTYKVIEGINKVDTHPRLWLDLELFLEGYFLRPSRSFRRLTPTPTWRWRRSCWTVGGGTSTRPCTHPTQSEIHAEMILWLSKEIAIIETWW